MLNKICLVFFVIGVLCLGIMLSLYAQEERIGIDPLNEIVELIQIGEWEAVLKTAREFAKEDDQNEFLHYIADLAAIVLSDHSKPLSVYDFPYADKQAMKALKTWAKTLLKNQPNNVGILILNGMLHSPKGDDNIDKFREYFEQAKSIDENNNVVFEALGFAYGAQGKYDLAIDSLRQAVKIKPTSGAYTNMGVAFLKQGKSFEAMKNFTHAVETDDTDPVAWSNLGSYYAGRNQLSKAKSALENSLELSPKNLDALWNLGGVYFNSRQPSLAIKQLKKMIRIAPDSPMGRQAKEMLSKIGG